MTAGTIPYAKYRGQSVIDPQVVANHQQAIPATPLLNPPSPPPMAEVGYPRSEPPVTRAEVLSILERVMTEQANPKRWLTLAKAAEYTGLSERFLRKMVRAGELAFVLDKWTKVRRDVVEELELGQVRRIAKKRGRK